MASSSLTKGSWIFSSRGVWGLQYLTMGHSERFGTTSLPALTSSSQVFVMGYYADESADTGYPRHEPAPPQDNSTIPPHFDQGRAKLRTNGKVETLDRVTGAGPEVTETSTVEIRYEIKTAGGVVIDSNRKSNTRNNNLVSASFETSTLFHRHPQ